MSDKLFTELRLQRLKGDQAVYLKKDEYGNLEGMASTYVVKF